MSRIFNINKLILFFILLSTVNIILLFVGMYYYPEPFKFWEYPLSGIGATITENGFPNNVAALIYSIEMICSGLIMLVIAYVFWGLKDRKSQKIKVFFSLLCALGFFISLFPTDTHDNFHVIGSIFMIGSLWTLEILLLNDLKPYISKFNFLLCQVFLHAPVITYAITYFTVSSVRQITQKFAIYGLLLLLPLTTIFLKYLKTKVE